MIELLQSNYMPLVTDTKSFETAFFNLLGDSKKIRIASGYISEDSITQIIGLYENGLHSSLELIVGMHYFEGFTKLQFDALKKLNSILESKNCGKVFLSTVSKYHGKVYSFIGNRNNQTVIIGSSNLTKICNSVRVYDTDVIINDTETTNKVNNFINDLITKYCKTIDIIDESKIPIINNDALFSEHTDVQTIDKIYLERVKKSLSEITYDLPLKTESKSGLNAFHGKGRLNKSNGLIIPRDWYEVELIIPKSITQDEDYPKKDQVFTVITDDGYSFKCKTSGDYSKNFRSAIDLKVLGRWIKGRLENAGSLGLSEMVTEATLNTYGRNTIKLTKVLFDDLWFLDFGV